VKLSVTSWSFPACTLPEVAGIAKALGILAVDLGYFYASALDKAALLADPEGTAARLVDQGVSSPCLYHLFGDTLSDRNLADPRSRERNIADSERVAAFCRAAGIPTVFVLPGVCNPGQGRAEALRESAASLRALVRVAEDAGVQLTVEPHVHAYLESPSLVLRLLEQVPGLKLTLDYAHFVCLGYRQEDIDVLAPHAAHVHLRQARPGALQAKGHEGTINMEAMLGTLRDAGYGGWLALEYVHQDYMGTLHDDVLTETVRLRDRVRAWMAAG
jgi:sugar phosphate isomerase/epimerase